MNEIMKELKKEIVDYHSNQAILDSSLAQQRLFYSLTFEYSSETIQVIADRRLKISQYSMELKKMEKELVILQTLKMEHNIADVEKNKKLRNTMIAKWRMEEDRLLYEMKDLEGKVSSLLKQEDVALLK